MTCFLSKAILTNKYDSFCRKTDLRSQNNNKHEDKPLHRTIEEDILNALHEDISFDNQNVYVLSNSHHNVLHDIPPHIYSLLIDLCPLNRVTEINERLFAVNAQIPKKGFYVCCYKPGEEIKKEFLHSYPMVINYVCYALYYLAQLVFPFSVLSSLPFACCKMGRVLSFAELLGRLYYCGFHLKKSFVRNDLHYFFVERVRSPLSAEPNRHYGFIIKLPRVCKGKKIRPIYKLRTMSPYAEYIHSLVFKHNKMNVTDKAAEDFRITTSGRWLRRYFIDEIPMIINLLKGDIKLVGVRPLSVPMFKQYPKSLRDKRIRCKPGLFPPFYVHHPSTLAEVYESENKYLDAYFAHPFKTDVKYFFLILYSILFKGTRSA